MWEWYKGSLIGRQNPFIQLIFWIIVIILLVKGWRYIMALIPSKGQQQELTDTKTEIKYLQQQGIQPSFSPAQYSTWANQLQQAFDGCGTSNVVWENIFSRVKNDLDIALLIDAYGTRQFDECNFEFDFGDFKGTLSEALIHELSSSEIEQINEYLQRTGIKYRF